MCLRVVSACACIRYADHVKDMAVEKAQKVLAKSIKATVDFYKTNRYFKTLFHLEPVLTGSWV